MIINFNNLLGSTTVFLMATCSITLIVLNQKPDIHTPGISCPSNVQPFSFPWPTNIKDLNIANSVAREASYPSGGFLHGDTPKSSRWMGFSLVNYPFGGTPIHGTPYLLFRLRFRPKNEPQSQAPQQPWQPYQPYEPLDRDRLFVPSKVQFWKIRGLTHQQVFHSYLGVYHLSRLNMTLQILTASP